MTVRKILIEVEAESYDERAGELELSREARAVLEDGLDAMGYKHIRVIEVNDQVARAQEATQQEILAEQERKWSLRLAHESAMASIQHMPNTEEQPDDPEPEDYDGYIDWLRRGGDLR